jgi:hypothetical protein
VDNESIAVSVNSRQKAKEEYEPKQAEEKAKV